MSKLDTEYLTQTSKLSTDFYQTFKRSVSGLQNLVNFVSLKVSASTIRTIDKVGLDAYAKKNGITLK